MLTQHRISAGRVAAVAVFIYVLLAAPPRLLAPALLEWFELLGFAMLVIAALGRIWCGLFIHGSKNQTLVMEGPYSVARNPLYLFSFVGAIGFGLAVGNPLLAAVIAIFIVATYPAVVAREERNLNTAFGAAYATYCQNTPRWMPNWRQYREPATLTLSPARMRRSIFDAMWFLWAFLLAELLELLRQAGVLPTLF